MIPPALVIFAFVALCILCAVVNALTRQGPRPESRSERNHRIDDEALAACVPDYEANVAAFDAMGRNR